MKKLSIVIVTYNSTKLISDCLDSILNNNDIGDSLEVIVVDNASEEQYAMFEGIRKLYADKIILVNSGKNGGYGYGNNIGFEKSTSDIVIVMNPDVRLVSPIFRQIISLFDKDSRLGLIGVSFVDGSSPFYYKPGYETFLQSVFIHQLYKILPYNPKKMFLSGSFLAFNKNAFKEAGRFDDNIFMYYEEPDITNRILKACYNVEWHPEIKVLHMAHGRTYNQKQTAIMHQSFEYYCKKYDLSAKKEYKASCRLLKLKRFVAWVVRDKRRYDVFTKTLHDIKNRIRTL